MTLNEKYRIHNRKKSYKSILIYVILFCVFFISNSFARYSTVNSTVIGVDVANWNIKINGIDISQNENTIHNEIELIVTENKTQDNLIEAGQSGYFDIEINPADTEVSIAYKIILDTSNLPEGIKLKNYTINNSAERYTVPQDKIINGNIDLNNKESLTEDDILLYRVYWNWDSTQAKIENIEDNYKIMVEVQVEQET